MEYNGECKETLVGGRKIERERERGNIKLNEEVSRKLALPSLLLWTHLNYGRRI